MNVITNVSEYQSQVYQRMLLSIVEGNITGTVSFLIKISLMLGIFGLIGRLMGNSHSLYDTGLLGMFLLFTTRAAVSQAISQVLRTKTYLYVAGTCLFQVSIATATSKSNSNLKRKTISASTHFLGPRIFPCRTTHTRLFPTKHSFSYSYLFVGVPVGWQGVEGDLLTTSEVAAEQGWFTIHSEDYLARGKHKEGLSGKLKDYLSSQDIPTHRYSYAYLVTAPRFLGFSFNPVSFWYLYNHTKVLSAMILEVNNTFDERRMYLMERNSDASTAQEKEFQSAWSKDFHVSPFNDREGSYSLKAKDLLLGDQHMSVDNNIVLRDDSGRAKLVARVFSTEHAVDPSIMSKIDKLVFVAKWWWVGFMTNPRILREARKLWVKRLQVYYRPEVYKTSIGRSESTEEVELEAYFRSFLINLVNATNKPTTILYKAAAGTQRGKDIRLTNCQNGKYPLPHRSLTLHVLTPAFYGEIARTRLIEAALDRVCFTENTKEIMLETSDDDLLRMMLQNYISQIIHSTPANGEPISDEMTVSALRDGSNTSILSYYIARLIGRQQDLCRASEYDCFVKISHSPAAYQAYLKVTQKLLLTDKIAFGLGWLLDLYKQVLRIICLSYMSHELARLKLHSSVYSLLPICLIYHSIAASSYQRQPANPNSVIATFG